MFFNGCQHQLGRLNDILSIMKKISLNVLLRFLSKYSHWNLVRRADGYHLYFIAQQQGDVQTGKIGKYEKKRNRKLASVSCNKIRKNNIPGKLPSKDVFVFNPIFNNIEDGVAVGLDSAAEQSRRSSVSSFIWDDFLPTYKEEERTAGKTGSCSESSGQSTPVPSDNSVMEPSQVKEKFYEASVLQQGDRLLKEMLELRKDLEKEKLDLNLTREGKEKECSLLPNYGPLEHSEENMLREKLEMMTQQIKREMEDQFNRNHAELDCDEEEKSNIRNIFKSLVQVENNQAEIAREETLQSEINNLLITEESSETFEEAKKQCNNQTTVETKKKDKTKNQTKQQAKLEEIQSVEVPLCSHVKNVKDLQTNDVVSNENEKDVKAGKADETLLLTPDEKIAAEEILRELVDIRNSRGGRTDPVVDTMIR